MMSDFDRAVVQLPDYLPWKAALIEVMDTADMVHVWFRDRDTVPTGSNVAAMTKLVMERAYVSECCTA